MTLSCQHKAPAGNIPSLVGIGMHAGQWSSLHLIVGKRNDALVRCSRNVAVVRRLGRSIHLGARQQMLNKGKRRLMMERRTPRETVTSRTKGKLKEIVEETK